MSINIKIGDILSLGGVEFLATRDYFALLDENRQFKKGQTVECLPCLKKVKHSVQGVAFSDAYKLVTNGIVVDKLEEKTMQSMVDNLIVNI